MSAALTERASQIAARPDRRGRRLAGYWPLLPVLLAVTLIALPTLAWPWGADQAIFATIGDAINHGRWPYIDAWDQKPPGIYLLYALALRLPGPLMGRVRAFDILWTLAAVALLYELARGFWNTRAATFAALLFGAIYFTTQGWWYLAQPDGLLALPLLGSLLLITRARGRWAGGMLVAAGALGGAVFLLRFTAAPVVPLAGLLEWRMRRERWPGLLRRAGWIGAGFLAVQLSLAAYLASGHAIHAYIEASQFATGYTQLGWPFAPLHPTAWQFLNHVRGSFLLFALANIVLVLPALAGMFAAVALRPDPRARHLTVLALVAYLGIASQQKFFWYHWQVLLPLLALLAGWAWDGLFSAIERALGGSGRELLAKAVLIGGLTLATPSVLDGVYAGWNGLIHLHDSRIAWVRYNSAFGGYGEGTYSYLADVQVAQYLRLNSAPADRVYIFGYDPLIYLLSERESSSRFIYALPLMSYWAPERWTDQFLGEIDRHQPLYILVQRNEGAARWITGQSEDTAVWAFKIEGLARRLERDYALETEIEDFSLYRRIGR